MYDYFCVHSLVAYVLFFLLLLLMYYFSVYDYVTLSYQCSFYSLLL